MSKQLSIGMMVRSYIPVPQPDDLVYAPINLMIQLAKGLADKGHQITIFAPKGSHINYPNITVESLSLEPFVTTEPEFQNFLGNMSLIMHGLHMLQDWQMAQAMFEQARQGRFDVLHFHHPEVGLPLARHFKDVPTLYTLHDPLDQESIQVYQLHLTPNQSFVAISQQQIHQAQELPIKAIIHHGINLPEIDPTIQPDDSLLFVGRIVPEKGVKEAIEIARRSNRRLTIIGPVYPTSQGYFDKDIKPHLNQRIRHLGTRNHSELSRYFQRAAAVLTPVQWDEPFGMTTIEAMANGAPVISLNRGAAPEIIIDQETGFIANNLDEMVEAVKNLPSISRKRCRQHIEANFSTAKYVEAMEKAYLSARLETAPNRKARLETSEYR